MNRIFNATSVAFGVVCGIAAKLFGAWDGALWALVVIMALDYVTGIIKAVYTKTVSSETGYKGILKKIMILVVVALANTVTNLTGGNMAVREVVIMFYIANEGISVLENAAAVSPNMPQKLKDILLQIRGNDNDNRN
ncbi:MAG: phage holin family protein [Clostridia bacterium]|nr:phage holin family protein [Clostridia bacterium]